MLCVYGLNLSRLFINVASRQFAGVALRWTTLRPTFSCKAFLRSETESSMATMWFHREVLLRTSNNAVEKFGPTNAPFLGCPQGRPKGLEGYQAWAF